MANRFGAGTGCPCWKNGSGPGAGSASGFGLHLDSPALAKVYNSGWREPTGTGSRVVIGFSLDAREAVDQTYAKVTAAGHAGVQPPYDTFWGAGYAVVEDPDGNHVGLMSPLDPSHAKGPPAI